MNYYHVSAFNCIYVICYLKEYFTTAILECFRTVSKVDVNYPGEMVDILHS